MTKVVLIISGASRGLGRALARAFCDESTCAEDHHIVRAIFVARSEAGLKETVRSLPAGTNTSAFVADLADLDQFDHQMDQIMKLVGDDDDFDRLVFINNAGSLGHLGPCIDAPSLQDMRETVDLNVTSALWASVRIARFAATRKVKATTICNISSLVAIQPFPTMAIYSAGKAARDSYHAAMATEMKKHKDSDAAMSTSNSVIKILNYAPGPLETDMSTQIRSADALDDELKPHFQKQLVDPADSAAVLVKIVLEDTFESGEHIDYYDVCSQEGKTNG